MTAASTGAHDEGRPSPPRRLRHGPQRALFDNPVNAFSMEELVDAARGLDDSGSELTAAQLADGVLTELAIKPTRRGREIVREAVRLARRGTRSLLGDVAATQWQAGSGEVRAWAHAARFDIDDSDAIAEAVITAYNRAHPDRPY